MRFWLKNGTISIVLSQLIGSAIGLAIDPGRVGSGRKFRSGRFVEKVEGSKKVDFYFNKADF